VAKPSWDFYNITKAALKPKALTPLEQQGNDFLKNALGVTSDWLQGKLSDDLTKAVRQATSEASVSLGLGTGSAARNLTIRDLGLTSLDLQEKGVKYGTSIADQIEKTREFNRAYELDVQKVLNSARALDLDSYRVQNELALKADELALRQTLGFAEISSSDLAARLRAGTDWLGLYADYSASDTATVEGGQALRDEADRLNIRPRR